MGKRRSDSYGSPFKMWIVRLLTMFVPGSFRRKNIRRRLINRVQQRWLANFLPGWRAHYSELQARCSERRAAGHPLRAVFLVVDASMFSAEPIFVGMLASPGRWQPQILVVPDLLREREFAHERMRKAFALFDSRYPGCVFYLQDPETGVVRNLSGAYDLAISSNPYPDQTLPCVSALELGKDTLVCYIPYSYGGHLQAPVRNQIMRPEMSLFWRVWTANPAAAKLWGEANPHLKDIIAAIGYPKSDRLARISPDGSKTRKQVILAPHHSLGDQGDGLKISNFLRYADFFMQLPEEYPQIDFVFRPHPLLRERLSRDKWWGKARTDEWFAKLESHGNVEYQDGGDYFATFVNADALIHDCGSFLPEYFFTGHPQCFLVKDENHLRTEFSDFGHRLLDHVYKAGSEEEIRRFLDMVVLKENDPMASDRATFAKNEVCVFYPRSSAHAIDILDEAFAKPTQGRALK